MHFIDEAKIHIKSGDGGDGVVSFRREKFAPNGGPDGGNGGRGGSIIFESDFNINTLLHFRYKQHFKAARGENGKRRSCTGSSSPNIVLKVPVGTQVFDETGNLLLHDFTSHADQFLAAKGGRGGAGNSNFKSSTQQAPRYRTKGEAAEEMWVWLKLKLLSDVGIIGMPNAGKSTFLSKVTNAKPKIGDYPFTTLAPTLGIVHVEDSELVLADIPGLIEGASAGHGLGDKFLKHIERCKVLLHLIDIKEDVVNSYATIRNELEKYSNNLRNKDEIICLNKCESVSKEDAYTKQAQLFSVTNKSVYIISTYMGTNLTEVLCALKHLLVRP